VCLRERTLVARPGGWSWWLSTPAPRRNLSFDLSAFSQVSGGNGGVVPRRTTVPAGTDRYAARSDLRPNGKSLTVAFLAGSVQTVQVEGVMAWPDQVFQGKNDRWFG
jgi:hypothetical protein